MDYGTLLRQKAVTHQDKPFLIWDGVVLSYAALLRRAEELAARIRKEAPGHRLLGIWSKSPSSQLTAFLAAELAGVVPVIIHEYMDGEKLAAFLDARPLSFLLRETADGWQMTVAHRAAPLPGAVCMGVLTSGTSGLPKELYRTYESWADFFPEQNHVFGITADSRTYIQGSLGFTGNLSIVLGLLGAGGTIIGTSSLRPKNWMQDIIARGVTHLYMIPSKLSALVRAEGEANSVAAIISGSQLMTPALLERLAAHFPHGRTILYYGSTEMNYVSYIMGDELLTHPGCVGRPFPGVAVSADDGELLVTTKGLVYGKTSPFRSGDLGRIDGDGCIHFLGRRADQYNIKGNHVTKAELVACLKAIPGIQDADILPFTTESGETKLAAFLVAADTSRSAVLSHLRAHLEPWKIPARFLFLKEFPTTSTGKVDYEKLRELMDGGDERQAGKN